MNTTESKTGVVKFFNSEKGFGFLIDDESGTEIFVHATATKQKIVENDKVSFTIGQGKKGELAENVVKL